MLSFKGTFSAPSNKGLLGNEGATGGYGGVSFSLRLLKGAFILSFCVKTHDAPIILSGKKEKTMKKNFKISLAVILAMLVLLFAVSCRKEIDTKALWANASYTTDIAIGEGTYTFTVKIVGGEKSIVLTVSTDKETVGEALYENSIIDDPSFFDTCIGIKADYNKDSAYWNFLVDGASASYGVGDPKASTSSGSEYSLVYTVFA